MIRIRRSTDTGLEAIERPTKGCWIEVIEPDPDEAANLPRDLNVPAEFVAYSLDPDKISLVEKSDGALLILVRIGRVESPTANIPYETLPLGIIVVDDSVVTICRHEHELLRDLPQEHQADVSTANPARFVLHLLWSVANNYLRHVSAIEKIVEDLEDRLQRSLQNREVLELLRYQKSLVHFTTALRANETMLERLQRSKFLEMEDKDEDLLDDVFTESRQAIGMTETAGAILSQMMDAFASIISNNLNMVMKFLASVTVILLVPTVIAGFYGMNVGLPFEASPFAFLGLIGFSLLTSVIVGLVFWRRGWL
jgi:magnesium transporter